MQIISRNQLLNLKHLAAPCGAVNKILSELMCYFAPTNVYVYSIKKHEILLSLSLSPSTPLPSSFSPLHIK